jgi:hypothetical protein
MSNTILKNSHISHRASRRLSKDGLYSILLACLISYVFMLSLSSASAATPTTPANGGYNLSDGYSVIAVSDGYLIAGSTFRDGDLNGSLNGGLNTDVYLIKTDLNGNLVWDKSYGGEGGDFGRSVVAVSDGYVIAGDTYSYGSGSSDIYLIKTDLNGNIVWNNTFGGPGPDDGMSLAATDDGYAITGRISSDGNNNAYLVKADRDGNLVWQKTYIGSQFFGESVIAVDDGFVITGCIMRSDHSRTSYLLKTDRNGEMVWRKVYNGKDNFAESVAAVNDGYILAGTNESVFPDDSAIREVYLIKTDKTGNMTWNRTYKGDGWDNGRSVIPVADGYIIAGNYGTGTGTGNKSSVYLVKTDLNGNMVWNKTLGHGDGASVTATNDGYVVVGDTSSYGAGPSDVYLVETDLNGNMVWNKTFSGRVIKDTDSKPNPIPAPSIEITIAIVVSIALLMIAQKKR